MIARFNEYRFESNAWRNSRTKLYLHLAVFCSLTYCALLVFLWVFMLFLFAHVTLSHLDYLKNSRFIFYVPTCVEPPLYFPEPTCIWAVSCMQYTKEDRDMTLKPRKPGFGYELHPPFTNSMTLNKLPNLFIRRRGKWTFAKKPTFSSMMELWIEKSFCTAEMCNS